MPSREKRAWVMLSIIVVIFAAYFVLVPRGWRLDSVSLAVLALVGFIGFRPIKRRSSEVLYDERDLKIERQALPSSLCLFYILMIIFSVSSSITHGWDASVSIEKAVEVFWMVSLAIWAIKALIVIVLYRRGAHA